MVRVSTVFSRLLGAGALGSITAASGSSSVVIVKATVQGICSSRSASRATISDLVKTWSRQLLSVRILRHWRVWPNSDSTVGYGSDEVDIARISPFSLAASRRSVVSSVFLVRSVRWFGM